MALEADLLLNTRRFQAGVEDAERELRDFTDVLDALGDDSERSARTGERAMERLGDGIGDAARELDELGDADPFDKLGRGARDVEDDVRDLTRRIDDVGDAGRDAGREAARGFDRASEGVEELRDEANSTAREAAASFDGSAESIADAFQEVAANAFAGFGPGGAIAGLAAAGGIGLAIAAFENVDEANQASQERIGEWADRFIEAGGRVLTASQQIAMLQEIVTDPEQWQAAQANAENWGVSVSTAMRAMTGDADALAEANRNLTDREREAAEGMVGISDSGEMLSEVLQGQTAQARAGRDALELLNGELASGRDAADAYNDAMIATARGTRGATESVDEFGNTVIALPDGETVYIDAETGRATRDVNALSSTIRGVPDGSATVTASVNDAAVDRYMRRDLSRFADVQVRVRQGIATWY